MEDMNDNVDKVLVVNENLPEEKLDFLKSIAMRLVKFPTDRIKKMNAKRSFLIPSLLLEYKKWPLIYLLAFLKRQGKVKIRANKKLKAEVLIAVAMSEELPMLARDIRKIGKENGFYYRRAKDREILSHALLDLLTIRYHYLKKDKKMVEVLVRNWDIEWIDEDVIKIEFEERG